MKFLNQVKVGETEDREQEVKLVTARHETSAMPYGHRPRPNGAAVNLPPIRKALPDDDLRALDGTRRIAARLMR